MLIYLVSLHLPCTPFWIASEGGYVDDEDHGDHFDYTGMGGKRDKHGHHVSGCSSSPACMACHVPGRLLHVHMQMHSLFLMPGSSP